jgi:hypothetical protein
MDAGALEPLMLFASAWFVSSVVGCSPLVVVPVRCGCRPFCVLAREEPTGFFLCAPLVRRLRIQYFHAFDVIRGATSPDGG